MGGNGEKSSDFYQVLGLKKECTEAELKIAYKKLALKWHPDRCSAAGNSKYVEESKNKFQAIQEAYSVLSNANKRFLYDVGVYDSDDDENGMADFMSEMAVMMTQNKPNEKGESYEELKDLFEEMFDSDIKSFGWSSQTTSYSSSLFSSCGENSSSASSNKRSNMKTEEPSCFDGGLQGFSLGVDDTRRRGGAAGGRGGISMPNPNANAARFLVKTGSEESLFEDHSNGYSCFLICNQPPTENLKFKRRSRAGSTYNISSDLTFK